MNKDKKKLHFEDEAREDETSGQFVPKSRNPHEQFHESREQPPLSSENRQSTTPDGDGPESHDKLREHSAQATPSVDNELIGVYKDDKKKTAKNASNAYQNKHRKFREYSKQELPSERLQHDAPPPGASPADKKAARDGKRLNRSKLRMEKTGTKLEKAIDKKAKQKPYKPPGALKSIRQAATFEGIRYVHGKVYQHEHENVGVEAAHHTELAGEKVFRGTKRFVQQRNRTRPARRVRKWQKRDIKAKANFQYKKMVQENPVLKKNAISRFIQKQKNKRRFQKQARQAAKRGAKAAKKTAVTTEKIAVAVGRFAVRHPVLTLIAAAVFLLIVTMQSCVGTFTMVGNGITGTVGGAMENAEAIYTGFETDLQLEINGMETTRPGYDEYRRNIGPIGHSFNELTGFLLVCDSFAEDEMESVLRSLFDEQYTLTTREIVETRTETTTVQAGESIGPVRITGYCACEICCGPYANGITASGVTAAANRTIAVDAYNPIVPMGTQVFINGRAYIVEDTGNLAANNADFDIYFATHAEAMAWGRQTYTAYLAEDGEVTTTTEYRILEITLTVKPFTEAIASRLTPEQLERFNQYDYSQ